MPGNPAGSSLPSVCMESSWEGRVTFCPYFFCALANGISLFSVERENVQKRTFTRWINLHLEKASGVWEHSPVFAWNCTDGSVEKEERRKGTSR